MRIDRCISPCIARISFLDDSGRLGAAVVDFQGPTEAPLTAPGLSALIAHCLSIQITYHSLPNSASFQYESASHLGGVGLTLPDSAE